MAELSPALATALAAPTVTIFGAVEIAFPAGTVRLLDGSGEIMIGGAKFTGRDPDWGVLDTIKGIADSTGDQAPALQIGLIPSGDMALGRMLDPANQGSAVTVMDKTTVAFAANGPASGTYAGQIWQKTQLGATPEAAALVPPIGTPTGWTSAHKLSGLAAVMNTFAYDAKSKNGLTAVPQPAWIIHGVKVYDPRQDSTYPGGAGPCRAYDESTYVWSENPHLHGLTWALGRYQNGVRVAGIGIGNTVPTGAVRAIDIAAFVDGANLDDARGWKLGGQVYTRPDTSWNSLKAMLQAGGAAPVLIGGRISCINRAPRVSLATITHADIIGKCTFSGTQPKRSRINSIIPQYRSEAHDWEMVSAKAVSVADYVAIDGDERTRELPYPLVQDVNQVSQLATYDICDAREAGPGNVPLKPLWLNYRIGDCVTFAPEDGFSIKTLITGRAIDAQSGAVTMTLRGETDGKHAFALGAIGTAPPIASLIYDNTISAPTADWTLAALSLTGNDGSSIPALVLTGAVSNASADAAQIEYRLYDAGLGDDDGWIGASSEAPTLTRKEISTVTAGTQYQVGVRYRVRGALGDRAIFGPVTAGATTISGLSRIYIQQSSTLPATGLLSAKDMGSSVTVTIAAHSRLYPDKTVAIAASSISGLAYATTYSVYYDDSARMGGTETFVATTNDDAIVSDMHPVRHGVGQILTPAAGAPLTTGGGVIDMQRVFNSLRFQTSGNY